MTGFSSLGVLPELVAALRRHGVENPFPIQEQSLPDSLAGRDVLGRGRTGSGKTIAFSLPVVTRLLEDGRKPRPGHPRALVLVPTRELAVQVNETMGFLAKATGLKTMTVYGGVSYTPQLRKLEAGVDIMIATPGRLEDLMERGSCNLGDVRIAVLDEADLMADMGFLPAVMRLLGKTAPGGQRMLFSATLDGDVKAVVNAHLKNPVEHSVAGEEAPDIVHRVFLVTKENKVDVLADLVSGEGRSLVFSRTKHGATRLAKALAAAGVPALELHGDLRQAARQRNLSDFSSGHVRVLVATDVAARGIHVDDIALVVHADPPNDPKAFVHRSGRTARAGASGVVVTLCLRDQNRAVKALLSAAKIQPIRDVVEPGAEVIAEVRGPVATPPVPRPAPVHVPTKSKNPNKPRRRPVREADDAARDGAAPRREPRQDRRPARPGGSRPGDRGSATGDRRPAAGDRTSRDGERGYAKRDGQQARSGGRPAGKTARKGEQGRQQAGSGRRKGAPRGVKAPASAGSRRGR